MLFDEELDFPFVLQCFLLNMQFVMCFSIYVRRKVQRFIGFSNLLNASQFLRSDANDVIGGVLSYHSNTARLQFRNVEEAKKLIKSISMALDVEQSRQEF